MNNLKYEKSTQKKYNPKISAKDWKICIKICEANKVNPTPENIRAAYMSFCC